MLVTPLAPGRLLLYDNEYKVGFQIRFDASVTTRSIWLSACLSALHCPSVSSPFGVPGPPRSHETGFDVALAVGYPSGIRTWTTASPRIGGAPKGSQAGPRCAQHCICSRPPTVNPSCWKGRGAYPQGSIAHRSSTFEV
ncbi:hypothetical protein E8E14_013772 [Neopestalotiopsis sp. 37M]|nr:hypothetical protein E8E14_013772 [Neopestalotiopsis sp. 37M]